MDWRERFLADAERLFQLPRERLEKFLEQMEAGAEGLQEWAEESSLGDMDLLMLLTVYSLYKTEERVMGILSGLDLKVEEAVTLASTAAASVLNGVGEEERRVILAQLLLAVALQLEDQGLRNSLAEYARTLVE